jgi:uncharacterized LabA/DUF88 family protein
MATPTFLPRETAYLFIDGGYLRHLYTQQMKEFFGCDGTLSFKSIKNNLSARKAFYYDGIAEQQPDEADTDYKARVEKQIELFRKIRLTEGYHVRPGAVVGESKKKIRQKEVDVALAVDTLNHAFRGNMTTAKLITGDRDFKPLVDSLVSLGTYVELWADKATVADALIEAADTWNRIKLTTLHNWSEDDFVRKHRLPQTVNLPEPPPSIVRREALYKRSSVKITEAPDSPKPCYYLHCPDKGLLLTYDDRSKPEQFFEMEYGPLTP